MLLAAAQAPIDLNHETIRAKEPVISPAPSFIQRNVSETGLESVEFSFRDSIYKIKFLSNWAERTETHIPNTKIIKEKTLPIKMAVQEGNTCGPTSLYMSLRALGVNCTENEIEKKVLCSSVIGTSPIHIKSAVLEYGLSAAIRNNATTQTVKNIIDSGGYAIALLQKNGGLHYVVIHGYKTSSNNKTEFTISDPNGFEYSQSDKHFSEEWSELHLRGIDLGFNRLIIAVTKEPIFSDSFEGKAETYSKLHGAINQFTSILGQFVQILEKVCSILGNLFTLSADAIPNKTNLKKIKN